MSRENFDLVKRMLAAYNRGDLEMMLAGCHPDIEVDWTRSIGPEPGMYRGREGFRRLAQSYGDVFDRIILDAQTFIDAGDNIVVPHVGRMRHRDGITASVPSVFVWTIKNGLAVRFRMFNSRDEALAAVGLTDQASSSSS